MAVVTTTGYLILGMLSERDWTAYELAEQVGKGVAEVWPRATRQLYKVPRQLAEDGLVEARTEATGRRTRTRYSITPAGRDALGEWLTTTPAPPALEFEAMVRVLVGDDGTLDDLQSTLMTLAEQARASRALFTAHARYMLETGGTQSKRRHLLALANRFMIGHFDHVIQWAEWTLNEIETWETTVDPIHTHVEETELILKETIRMGTTEPYPPE